MPRENTDDTRFVPGIEYLEICDSMSQKVQGYIPRTVVEQAGIDVSAIDHGGCYWFKAEDSRGFRAHPWWISEDPKP